MFRDAGENPLTNARAFVRKSVVQITQTHRGIREALAIAAADTPLAGAAVHTSHVLHEGNIFSALSGITVRLKGGVRRVREVFHTACKKT